MDLFSTHWVMFNPFDRFFCCLSFIIDWFFFQASLENGTVVGFDIRTAAPNSSTDLKPEFTLHAHDKAVCAISYNPLAPNVSLLFSSSVLFIYLLLQLTHYVVSFQLLATGSEDHMVI